MRAALVASCLRGAFPPVDLRAVCLVRAIVRRAVTECFRSGRRRGIVGLGGCIHSTSNFARALAFSRV